MDTLPKFTGTTKLVGLLGSPVAQSMSPAMHTASFAKMGVDAVYLGFDVLPDQLETVVKGFADAGIAGYNVTMPCKTKVLPYLDELSPIAELMGAVNTVVVKDGKSIGDNTDGAGFVRNMRLHGFEPEGKIVTVAGAGGAGSAVFAQLALDGVVAINIFNRHDDFWDVTKEKVTELASKTGVPMVLGDLDDKKLLARAVKNSDLFVNATRVGMAPFDDECVIDEDMLHEGLFVADTVYEPRETKLIRIAKEHGLQTAPGLGMLLQQAALGEKIWFDIEMPTDYIEEIFF